MYCSFGEHFSLPQCEGCREVGMTVLVVCPWFNRYVKKLSMAILWEKSKVGNGRTDASLGQLVGELSQHSCI